MSMKVPEDLFHGSFFFIDVVGLSKPDLSTQTQSTKIKVLNSCIAECDSFKSVTSERKIVQPTGDGMLIVFKDGLEKPIKLAIEVHQRLDEYNKDKDSTDKINVRIGCNSGNVFAIKDIAGNVGMWGAGVIIAKRVMDLGESGHILMSSTMAERLMELSDDYKKIIHPFRDYTIKHMEVILIYSVYGENFGNPNPPKIEMVKRKDQSSQIHELRKSISFKHLEFNMQLKNYDTNLLKIERAYSVANYLDDPIYEVINGITTNVPKTFSDLKVKAFDESHNELKIKNIHVDSPLRKEFAIKFNKPVYKQQQNRHYTLIHEIEEPRPIYEHFFLINSDKLTIKFSYPSNCAIKDPKLYLICRENREKKLIEKEPQLLRGVSTQVTWKIQDGVSEKDIMRLEW